MSGDPGDDAISPPPVRYEEGGALRRALRSVAWCFLSCSAGVGWAMLSAGVALLVVEAIPAAPRGFATGVCAGSGAVGLLLVVRSTRRYLVHERTALVGAYILASAGFMIARTAHGG